MKELGSKCEEVLKNPSLIDEIYSLYKDKQDLFRATSDLEVILTSKDVILILRKWLDNDISCEDIVRWSQFVVMSDAYDTPEIAKDYLHYDPLWDILGSLSTPEIDGSLTESKAKEYISELEKL